MGQVEPAQARSHAGGGRGVVRPLARDPGPAEPQRDPVRLLPGVRRAGKGAAGTGRRRRGDAAGGHHVRRAGAGESVEHSTRRGHRDADQPRGRPVRRGGDRRRAGRPGGRGLRGVRGPVHGGAGARGHRRPGRHELAHPQLPGLPDRGERRGSRGAGLHAGLEFRRRIRLREPGDRPARPGAGARGDGRRWGRGPQPGRRHRHRRFVPAARHPLARRADRCRRVLRRRHLRGQGDEGPGGVRGGRRELRRTGRRPPRQVRRQGDNAGPGPVAGREHVRVPGQGDHQHAQHRRHGVAPS